MELHTYTKKKPKGGSKSTMGIININLVGHIGINVFLQRTLNLEPGNKMLIARDLESRNDWYASFSHDSGEGYTLKYLKKARPEVGMTSCYQKGMIKELLDSVKAERSASFFVATGNPKIHNGRTWYRILTSTPKFIR